MKKLRNLVSILLLLTMLATSVAALGEGALSPEPVEFTVLTMRWGDMGDSFTKNQWLIDLEARTNVKINWQTVSSTDWEEQKNILLAGGELPDIVFGSGTFGDVDIMNNLEYFLPLEDLIAENMPNYQAALASYPDMKTLTTYPDGHIYTLAKNLPARPITCNQPIINKTWLDNLGLAVPTTLDELTAVLTAFKEQDANGNGDPNDEIPLSCCNWWGTAHPGMDTMAAAFSAKVNVMYSDPQTQKVTYWTEYNDGKNFKDYVTTMRKWYAEGLIDQEYVTQKFDQWAAKITGDKVGMFFCFPDNVRDWENSIKQTMIDNGYGNPDDVMIHGLVPIMGVDNAPYTADYDNAMVNFAGANQPTVITTSAIKNGTIEKCLEIINYLYSEEGSELINWGVEGVSFTRNPDGTHAWTDLVTKDPDYGQADAVFKYALPTQGSWPKAMSYEAWGSMNLVAPNQIVTHQNYAKGDTSLDLPSFALNYEEQEAYGAVMTDINTAISEVYLPVIMGMKPVEDLDKLLEQIDRMGIQQAIDAYQSAYDRYLTR